MDNRGASNVGDDSEIEIESGQPVNHSEKVVIVSLVTSGVHKESWSLNGSVISSKTTCLEM